ncbi:hypothetical protein NUU61_004542 [Penicillium alfredii]|uniref:Uncharacterized protein n=1 Tax=Penicillium alfredii TaxID=1506179 RepID=A0A9W9FLW0_9EURO|nr:uncharacterized protein NUU61_004542 [Penicillium alfredii]KAJ5102320.1 hypothetical protein NUU61_004542 [Penicillium alfredii]
MSTSKLESPSLFEVKGYVAVVTGASSGIGLMAAQTLAANGARVYIIGRKPEVLETVAEKYSSHGQIIPLPGDISRTDAIPDIASELRNREESGINILINTTGVSSEPHAKAESASIDFTDAAAVGAWMTRDGPEAWRSSYAGNVAAHHFLTAALLPLLDKGQQALNGGGGSSNNNSNSNSVQTSVVLNVASLAGVTKTHSQGQFAYSSSKAALIHLTREWAHAFMPLGVRVNGLAPGLFPSDTVTERAADRARLSRLEGAGERFPAGRIGRAEDIGAVVLYLCSRAGSYVNGQIISLDGGLLLRSPGAV